MEYILIRWFEKHETAHVYISNWHLHVISLGIAYVTLKLHNKHRTRIDVTSCVNDAQRIMSLMLKIVAIVKLAIMTISFIKCGWKCSKKLHSVGDLRKRHDRQHAQNMTDTSNFVNTFSVIALWMIGTWERFNFLSLHLKIIFRQCLLLPFATSLVSLFGCLGMVLIRKMLRLKCF